MSFLNQFKTTKPQSQLSEETKAAIDDSIETQEPIKVIICGEINAGKSSFINSLIGEHVLPSTIAGHTAAVHYCKHGAQPIFRVKFRDTGKTDHVDRLSKDALKAYLNEAGSQVEVIEIEHPAIPVGFVITDSPGINDEDPYRNTLVHAFMADSDVLVFMCDINRPVTAAEVGFLRTFTGNYRLNNCIFVANKVDLRPAEEHPKLLQGFLRDLRQYINKDISENQIALMTTAVEKDQGASSQKVMSMISQSLSWREQIQLDRAVRSQILRLSEECAVLSASLEQRQNLKGQYDTWAFRANRLLENQVRLQDGRTEIVKQFKREMDQQFQKVQEHLIHICQVTVNPAQLQQISEEKICEAMSSLNATLAGALFKNPGLMASSPSLESVSIDSQKRVTETSIDTMNSRSIGQMAFMGSGLLGAIGLGALLPLAVAGWGLYKMTVGHSADVKKQQNKIHDEAAAEISIRLEQVKDCLIKSLNQWFDKEAVENERRMQAFIKDVYCVFSGENTGSIDEVTSALKSREHQVETLKSKLSSAA
jgi:ribosome biogenesis GTPase A